MLKLKIENNVEDFQIIYLTLNLPANIIYVGMFKICEDLKHG
jgi:hypothetical protein